MSEEKISIELDRGSWNIILHALLHKTFDKQNSKLAQSQYENMYDRIMELTSKYGR